jgi:hypothetical protein
MLPTPRVCKDTPTVPQETQKRQSFKESDDLSGWPVTNDDNRVSKYMRKSDKEAKKVVLVDLFKVNHLVVLPKPFLVDLDADREKSRNDRGDIYQAFLRTSDVSIRGMFANGEPVYGTAYHRSGIVYTGEFKNGVADGFGEKVAGESVYMGRFHKGLRHGRGCLLDSKHYRLFMGMFENDLPTGEVLMIMFGWSATKGCAFTSHAVVTFEKGEVTKRVNSVGSDNAQGRCGLFPEEFMGLFRKCEKLAEDITSRKRLCEMNATETLWKPFGIYPFSA